MRERVRERPAYTPTCYKEAGCRGEHLAVRGALGDALSLGALLDRVQSLAA